ncbi:hypothetical protein [Streptomyces sp. NPDC056190]|uniref:hypothetical protein n=1 Tax=Streptomyces sp. NPDC056190 TaxID=3345741 RepID=UPI0035DBE2C7
MQALPRAAEGGQWRRHYAEAVEFGFLELPGTELTVTANLAAATDTDVDLRDV